MNYLTKSAALIAFVMLLCGLSLQDALANEPHEGLNFSIGVRGVEGCNTRASDASCTLPSGQPFVVEVSLDELPDDIHSYGGFDLYAEYTGVTPVDPLDASNDVWEDCGFPAAAQGDGYVTWGCAMGLPPAQPSSWIGPIGTVTFTCTTNGSISLVHKAGEKTDLIETVTENETGELESIIHSEGAGARETLTITCSDGAPTPTPTSNQQSAGTPTSNPAPVLPSTGQHPVNSARVPLAAIAALLLGSAGLLTLAALLRASRTKSQTAPK